MASSAASRTGPGARKRPRLHVLGPLKVMCFGDAVAAGDPTPRGFRAELAGDLEEFGIPFTFVGSVRGEGGYHEGWSALGTAELLPKLEAALTRSDPDVVLLHAGTNDLVARVPVESAAQNVARMLDAVAAHAKRAKRLQPVHVLLALVVPRNLSGGVRDEDALRYNDRLRALAVGRRASGPPITLVDLPRLMDRDRDYSDETRPNFNGYHKIGRAFALALRTLVTGE
jgi:lysophospholipase L1-like esterase